MRFAVASDDGHRVASHTGRCRGFVIYELAGKVAVRVEHRENTFTAHARGECDGGHDAHGAHEHDAHAHAGHGAHGLQSHGALLEALSDCRALVTRGLGPRLVTDLAQRGVDAYVCRVEGVEEAAVLYAQGQLPRVSGTGCSHA